MTLRFMPTTSVYHHDSGKHAADARTVFLDALAFPSRSGHSLGFNDRRR